jgi:hypothetical protein
MSHDVFINHSTAGKLTAYAICSELEAIGIRCWILPRDLSIGIAWDQSISNAVKRCRLMIVILSDYASRSDRVERQLELAFDHSVIVIPFRIEPTPVVAEPQPSTEPVHWLDAITPEMALRLRSLCTLVAGLILRQKNESLPIRTLTIGDKKEPPLRIDRLTDLEQGDQVETQALGLEKAAAELPDAGSRNKTLFNYEAVDTNDSADERISAKRSEKTSVWLVAKGLILTLAPFAIICAIGLWRGHGGSGSGRAIPEATAVAPIATPLVAASIAPPTAASTAPPPAASVTPPPAASIAPSPTASNAPPVAVKVQHLDKLAASNPGWGTLDANWTIADDKLRVTPLLSSSAILINQKLGFMDAEIAAEIAMSKGDDLDQLGGVIFWAKDYNDCYAFVLSADGKFALGRKLLGRWINPIAKTGNDAIKTGIGQTNKLRVRTEGNLLTAFINDIKVANLEGEQPQGLSFVGLYGESGEITQNVWEFSNVSVMSVR